MTSFRVVDSTTRWQSTFLTLDEATVEGADGETFTRTIVRHPGAVAVVAVDGDDVLLVRQYRAAVDRDLLEIVAGKRDVEGEPPMETARRELEEETGFTADRIVALGEFFNSPGFSDEHTYLFCALDLTELEERHTVTEEEAAMTVERLPLADVARLVAAGDIIDAKSIIGLLLAQRHLGAGPPDA